jgi:hypothetical protein
LVDIDHGDHKLFARCYPHEAACRVLVRIVNSVEIPKLIVGQIAGSGDERRSICATSVVDLNNEIAISREDDAVTIDGKNLIPGFERQAADATESSVFTKGL